MSNDFFYLVIGRLVTVLIGLISVRVLTSLLSPEEYGFLSVLVVFQIFSGLFLISPIGQFINRHTHEWRDSGVLLHKLRCYPFWVYLGAAIGAILSLVWSVSQDFSLLELLIITCLVFIMVCSSTANATLIPMLNMVGERKRFVLLGLLSITVSFLTSSLLTWFYPVAEFWFLGQMIGLIIGAVCAWAFFDKSYFKKDSSKFNQRLFSLSEFKTYIMPLGLASLLLWILLSGHRLVIEWYWGLNALGIFVIGFGIANQIWGALDSLVSQYFYPYFFNKMKNSPGEGRVAYISLLKIVIPLYLFIAYSLSVAGEYVFYILVDSSFYDGLPFMILGIWFEFLRVLTGLLSNYAQISKTMSKLIFPYSFGVGFFVVASSFIAVYGMNVVFAAYAVLCSMLLVFISVAVKAFLDLYISINVRDVFFCFLFLVMLLITPMHFYNNLDSVLDNVVVDVCLLVFSFAVYSAYFYANKNVFRNFVDQNLK